MPETSSLDEQTSGTALATAFLRALAACDPRSDIRGGDTLAAIFLDESHTRPLRDAAARAWVLQNKIASGAYEFMIARTAFFDGIVSKALKENIGQIVFLGAGYDSRSYRLSELIRDTQFFELDTAPTQARKKDCLQAAGIALSPHSTYVPVNFETDDLAAKLLHAGFSAGKKSLFIWEGVTYYLTSDAVDHLLAFVNSHSPMGSSIAFDYAALSDQALNEAGARELRQHLQARHSGEPIKFAIPAATIGPFLRRRGFEILEHVSASEMNKRYLAAGRYPELNEVPSLLCLVHAKVIGKD